jgi:hypothetical protein
VNIGTLQRLPGSITELQGKTEIYTSAVSHSANRKKNAALLFVRQFQVGMHRNANSWPKPNILKQLAESRNRIPNVAFAVFHSFCFNFSPLHKSNN